MERLVDSATALPNRTVWDLESDQRLLDPGPSGLDRSYDVLVAGGGVIGLVTALLCRRAGLGRVAVLEAGRLGDGPSGRGGGLIAPAVHLGIDPECLVHLGASSLELWKDLDRASEGALGVEPLDILQTFPPAGIPPADAWRVPEPPPGVERLDPQAARELEPSLAPGYPAMLLRDQARVHPLRLAGALGRLAGTVVTGVRVTGIEERGEGVRVRTDRGELAAGAVVLATGTAPRLDGIPPVDGRLVVKGTLLATEPVAFRLRAAVAGFGGQVFQLPDGRLVFGNTFHPEDSAQEVRPETLASTRAALDALVPAVAGVPLSHAWTCFRPATAGGLPVIDRVPGFERVWATYGHFRTGFQVATGTGRALARWISDGKRPDEVAAFAAA
jgi:glycine oxidase